MPVQDSPRASPGVLEQEDGQGVLSLPRAPGASQKASPGVAPRTPAKGPDLTSLYQTWKQDPSPERTSSFLEQIHPILQSGLRLYGDPDSPLQRGSARRIALEALPRYDPQKASLKTYLLTHLQGLRRLQASQDHIIHLPEQVLLDQHHLYEASEKLRDRLGRDPDDIELADATGLSLKRLTKLRQATGGVPQAQLVTQGEEGPEAFHPASRLPGQTDQERAWTGLVHQSLEPRDRLVLEHSLGLHGKEVLSGQQLARKLGLSAAAISQRKARIQAILQQREPLKLF